MTPSQLSYLAGLIDNNSSWSCYEQNQTLYIVSSSESQLKFVQSHFGGTIAPHHKTRLALTLLKPLAHILIRAVYPYLQKQQRKVQLLVDLPAKAPLDISHYVAGAIEAYRFVQKFNTDRQEFHYSTDCSIVIEFLSARGLSAAEGQYRKRGHWIVWFLIYMKNCWLDYPALVDQLLPKYKLIWETLKDQPVIPEIAKNQQAQEAAQTIKNAANNKLARIALKESEKAATRARNQARRDERLKIRIAKKTEREAALAVQTEKRRIKEELRLRNADLTIQGIKECSFCHEIKPLMDYGKCETSVDGHVHSCKVCSYERYKDLDKLNARTKAWQKANPEKMRAFRRKLRKKPLYRWKNAFKQRLRRLMVSKSQKTHEMLGCSAVEFQQYIAAKFRDGMTWDNYGKLWEMDHVTPLRAFDLNDPEGRAKAFHYTNHQPLLRSENNKKNDYLPDGRRARHVYKRPKPTQQAAGS